MGKGKKAADQCEDRISFPMLVSSFQSSLRYVRESGAFSRIGGQRWYFLQILKPKVCLRSARTCRVILKRNLHGDAFCLIQIRRPVSKLRNLMRPSCNAFPTRDIAVLFPMMKMENGLVVYQHHTAMPLVSVEPDSNLGTYTGLRKVFFRAQLL